MNTIRSLDPLARRPETWKLEEWLKANKYDVNGINWILDLGSCDLIETVELLRIFPLARAVAVEANPTCYKTCFERFSTLSEEMKNRIILVPYAVNAWNGRCRFWAIDPDKTVTPWIGGNLGASSLYQANGQYGPEEYHQNSILVTCKTLEYMMLHYAPFGHVFAWADLQGAELMALKSARDQLNRIDALYTEVSYKAAYHDQCMAGELEEWLYARGYKCAAQWPGEWQGDQLWLAE